MKKWTKIVMFCTCCLAFIGCDRLTKDLAKEHLKDKQAITYLNDTVRLQYVENTGAALSLGDDLPKAVSFWLLSILPLAVLLGLFIYTIKNLQQMGTMKIFSIALVFSGGVGNIIDRIVFDRHVTDFMNLGIGNIRTGIFNVADICVTAGVIGLLLFFNDKRNTPTITSNELPAP
ncbi:signal peptidase II [Ferruginibacter sp. SUN106]|uniref:signal peptidase II n=1 Tax=Ferruginibacter sp. SUN106 TaxID=2978348 RepID=UPI003D36E836